MKKNAGKVLKSTQEQAIAAWIETLNYLRRLNMFENLNLDEEHLEAAMKEIRKLKAFLADPSHILGSDKTKHGEIAEYIQVCFINARRLFEGMKPSNTFEGVGRTAPEDYLRNGKPVQMKFCKDAAATLSHVKDHLLKYPDFLFKGGSYVIPRDQYEQIVEVLKQYKKNPDLKLEGDDAKILDAIKDIEARTGLKFMKNVYPAAVDYRAVKYDDQLDNLSHTVNKEEKNLKNRTEEKEQATCEKAGPSVKEGIETVFMGAAVEGGFTFIMGIANKMREGKKLSEFTEEDWHDLGIDTGKASVEGGIRGGAVYILTNYTATQANIANAYVTAAYGIAEQACAFESGEIDEEEFILNSEILCLDVAVSAVSSLLGDILIPIPILGAIIGNAVGMAFLNICKNTCDQKEQAIAENCIKELEELNETLDQKFYSYVEILYEGLKQFLELEERAFDEDVKEAYMGSVELARYLGVNEDLILSTPEAVYNYFH